MIEWMRDGMVVESAAFTGIQELDLVFSRVNDSVHNQVYMCRVTRDGEDGMTVTAAQNFTVNVDGKMMISVRTVSVLCAPPCPFMITLHILFPQFHPMPSLPLLVVQAQPQLGCSTA
jgi:hypothetical protein